MPSYLHVPDLPPRDEDGTSFWYADLSLEVPVEHGWLASQPRAVGFQDESAREEVGRRLAWLRSRPALDGRFVRAVQGPTIDALRALMKDDAALFERLAEQVDEIGLLSDSRLDVGQAQLVILHKPDLGEDVRAWWEDLWPDLKSAADNEPFNLLPLEFADVGVYPTVRYRKLTRLPLSTMSPEPAWYGVDVDL